MLACGRSGTACRAPTVVRGDLCRFRFAAADSPCRNPNARDSRRCIATSCGIRHRCGSRVRNNFFATRRVTVSETLRAQPVSQQGLKERTMVGIEFVVGAAKDSVDGLPPFGDKAIDPMRRRTMIACKWLGMIECTGISASRKCRGTATRHSATIRPRSFNCILVSTT
jgi:hypothetical protein